MHSITITEARSIQLVRRRLAEIDKLVDDKLTTVAELLAIKGELLTLLGTDKSLSFDVSTRLARINLRLKAAPPLSTHEVEDGFPRAFKEVARQLLSAEVYDMLCRAANARLAEARAAQIATPAHKGQPAPVEPSLSIVPLKVVKTKSSRKPAAAAPNTPAPLSAPIHALVSTAASRPMRFDPTTLFKEFGRERCIAVWNFLPPEDRPETAAGFRSQLLRLAAENFFDKKKEAPK